MSVETDALNFFVPDAVISNESPGQSGAGVEELLKRASSKG